MARIEDQILEGMVNAGIGVSGLTQRAIGQSNLPNLQAAINTSRASMANLDEVRRQQYNKEILKATSPVISPVGARGGGGYEAGRPNITLYTSGKNTLVRVPGQMRNKAFNSPEIALDYLKNLVPAGTANIVAKGFGNWNPNQIANLNQAGVQFLQPGVINRAEGRSESYPVFSGGGVDPKMAQEQALLRQAKLLRAQNTVNKYSQGSTVNIKNVRV